MTDQAGRAHARTTDSASIASFFDDMSETRNEVFRSNPVLDYEQRVRSTTVLRLLQPQRGETILDIGCGNARDIVPMLNAGASVVGVDLSQGMIEQGRRDLAAAGVTGGVTLQVGDATALPFAAGRFDKVVCSEVIEHIPNADRAISEFRRVLKPGGLLVVSTPNRRSWYGFDRYVLWTRLLQQRWNHPFDNWRTRGELHALLERNGFELRQEATAVYLPGFLLTYFLPAALQTLLVAVVSRAEPLASRGAPANGYLLAAAAVKPA